MFWLGFMVGAAATVALLVVAAAVIVSRHGWGRF